ncbi:hypothetical protein FA95DRAFT_1609450 [Auriscalpium vulgare]|uniref:Uncharacterized protein n=1 Tax=Auriscalpium vulgare TaxID=40419 RepID=A0ACB8RH13_9AGAM|nr:hypothetical protein FA95DRAFT_1609450 [Auriscalpium vulgare]
MRACRHCGRNGTLQITYKEGHACMWHAICFHPDCPHRTSKNKCYVWYPVQEDPPPSLVAEVEAIRARDALEKATRRKGRTPQAKHAGSSRMRKRLLEIERARAQQIADDAECARTLADAEYDPEVASPLTRSLRAVQIAADERYARELSRALSQDAVGGDGSSSFVPETPSQGSARTSDDGGEGGVGAAFNGPSEGSTGAGDGADGADAGDADGGPEASQVELPDANEEDGRPVVRIVVWNKHEARYAFLDQMLPDDIHLIKGITKLKMERAGLPRDTRIQYWDPTRTNWVPEGGSQRVDQPISLPVDCRHILVRDTRALTLDGFGTEVRRLERRVPVLFLALSSDQDPFGPLPPDVPVLEDQDATDGASSTAGELSAAVASDAASDRFSAHGFSVVSDGPPSSPTNTPGRVLRQLLKDEMNARGLETPRETLKRRAADDDARTEGPSTGSASKKPRKANTAPSESPVAASNRARRADDDDDRGEGSSTGKKAYKANAAPSKSPVAASAPTLAPWPGPVHPKRRRDPKSKRASKAKPETEGVNLWKMKTAEVVVEGESKVQFDLTEAFGE